LETRRKGGRPSGTGPSGSGTTGRRLVAFGAALVLSAGLAPAAHAQYVGSPAPAGGDEGDPAPPGSGPVPGGDYVDGAPGSGAGGDYVGGAPGSGAGGDYVGGPPGPGQGGDYVGVLPAEGGGGGGVGLESAGLAVPLGRRMSGLDRGAFPDAREPALRIGPDAEERPAPGSPVSTSDVVVFGVVATAALAAVAARRARIPR
jgi:hypothetical protein